MLDANKHAEMWEASAKVRDKHAAAARAKAERSSGEIREMYLAAALAEEQEATRYRSNAHAYREMTAG